MTTATTAELDTEVSEEQEMREYRKQVAETILDQLGGRQMVRMTGTKNIAIENEGIGGVSFKIETTMFTKNKINHIKVILNGSDYYDVTFSSVRGSKIKQVSTHNDIDCFSLAPLFERETGMLTRL